ncbi:MAG TPA: hypothetical protein PL029_06800 [Bacteroidia bacterium]|nr:hypothetical protein [Bacteroidia bacterium]
MQKEDFILLPLEDRIEFLWKYGDVVSQMAYYDCDISLFLIDNYYVEVFFNRELKQVMSAEIQQNSQILYGYVKDLNIHELVRLLQ